MIAIMEECYERAYAKINIGLQILGRRSDGYHEIETIFQQIDLYDEIIIQKTDHHGIELWSNDARLPLGESNLCVQAAKLIRQHSGRNDGVLIRLYKHIPLAAGLGGGSSDAAAVLRGLSRLWRLDLSLDRFHELAKELGADVPFFLYGGTALGTGIGDQIRPIELPFNFFCVLVYPNIEISSRWAFSNYNFSLTKTKKSIKLSHLFFKGMTISDLRKVVRNDLEEVVLRRYPLLGEIKQMLYDRGAFFASMSGSGSTIYGLFDNYTDAVAVERSGFMPYQIIVAMPMITTTHL
ncbi:MAG: 4-(cytidine 5'-diphospho)-2-C-methyl-D-erythritol kinase [candidate division KSB1 bacterium]|nr:4-(cytidine 5'-diphospho)-2-C-methyl-D-erythritol kinase [candidate division KSB1 bacterium]